MKSSLLQLIASSKFELKEDAEDVSSQEGSYKGIRPEALYNSMEDFKRIFSSSFVSGTFVDLGCGTGLSCLVYGALFPERKAIGVEFEPSRLSPGKTFALQNKLTNIEFIEGDLKEISLPPGDTYFLYFPTGPILDRILGELYSSGRLFHLVVVESHGDLLPRIKKENWLKEVGAVPLHSPRHHPEAIIFTRTGEKRLPELFPHEISFQNKYLLLKDAYGEWIGDSYGIQWAHGESYDLLNPPRRIRWEEVKKILEFSELPETIQRWVKLRARGSFIKDEKIRKIYLKPEAIELSNGEIIK